jgi:ketosteroid isomerase-like protein
MTENYRLAQDFFAAVSAGELPDAYLTDDMTAWTTTQGFISKQAYQNLIKILAQISAKPLRFTIDQITAEADRIVAECHSEGVLINDEPYANTYVFIFKLRDGRIAAIAEHFNALIVQEKMMPLVRSSKTRREG